MKRRVRTGEPNKTKWSPHIDRMVAMAKRGMSYTEIGKAFGAPASTIRNALSRRGKYVKRKDVGQSYWRPIKTAPKDGRTIIVYEPGLYQTAAWTDGIWTNAANSWLGDVTHWMPLPKPPKE